MSTITRLGTGALAPFGWAHLSLFPLLGPSIRVEDHVEEDRYVVRAELPGVDPAKDVRVTVTEGALRLDVQREKPAQLDKGRAEFQYGSFYRIIPLPAGVQDKSITARYADGILEITAKIGEPAPAGKEIPIKVDAGRKN